MPDLTFLLISLGAQMLSGLLMAVGLVLGLRWAMPHLARALREELQRHPDLEAKPDDSQHRVRLDRTGLSARGRRDYLSDDR